MERIDPTYEKIIITLKKYADDNRMSIDRARYILSVIHRFDRPFNTRIIDKLSRIGLIKLNGKRGDIEILN